MPAFHDVVSWPSRGLALVALLAAGLPAGAATFTVDTTADAAHALPLDGSCATTLGPGPCTLRAAVQAANVLGGGPHTITLTVPGTYTLSVTGPDENRGATGDLDVNANVIIANESQGLVTISGPGGPSGDRVFDVGPSISEGPDVARLELSGVTVENGNPATGEGGGIHVDRDAFLVLSDATVQNNTTTHENGAGIDNEGTATLTRVTISGNTVTDAGSAGGGGFFNGGTATLTNVTLTGNSLSATTGTFNDPQGGGLFNNGTLTVAGAVISGNSVTSNQGFPEGAGFYNNGNPATLSDVTISGNMLSCASGNPEGAGLFNNDVLTLTSSTISDNMLTTPGQGAGVFNNSPLTLTNVTISGNSLAAGMGGGFFNNDMSLLTNVTIAGNSAPTAGGIFASDVPGGITLRNTIVAGNSGGDCAGPPAMRVPIVSLGGNLGSDASCDFGGGTGDLNETDPMLGPLADNGGPTRTRALLAGSRAVDTGTDAGCPAVDQRGAPRPVDGDGDGTASCDRGAYELGGIVPVGTTTTTLTTVSTTSSTTATPATSSTTTTRPASPPEVCDNCLDDDGDGAVDDEDADCCPARAGSVQVKQAQFVAGKGGLASGRLALTAVLASAGAVDPGKDGVRVQLRSARGELLCATIGHADWTANRKHTSFTFKDKSGTAAAGLRSGRLKVRSDGSVVVTVKGAPIDLTAFTEPSVTATIRVGDHCPAGDVHLKGSRKGLVFP